MERRHIHASSFVCALDAALKPLPPTSPHHCSSRRMGFPLKPLTGLWGFPPFSNASQCAPGECGADPDWELPLDEGIRQVNSSVQ